MSGRPEFDGLMERVQARSQDAVGELLERYGQHILRVVRRKLNSKLRSKFNSSDFVQAVWASFFALPLDSYRFERSDALAAFLAGIAHHKVVEVVRQRLRSLKYNVNLERPLLGGLRGRGLPAREPTPLEIAIAKEEWENVLAGSKAPDQEVLVSLREGSTPREVAARLEVSEKTVRRVLRRARAKEAS